jgi:hypothetical protein
MTEDIHEQISVPQSAADLIETKVAFFTPVIGCTQALSAVNLVFSSSKSLKHFSVPYASQVSSGHLPSEC